MYNPGIKPNWSWLPGMGFLSNLVGSTVAAVLYALVACLVVGGACWAGGNHWDHGRVSQAGKKTVFVCFIAAFLVGAASPFINFFATQGSGI